MTISEGLCAIGLIWSMWKGYRDGLFGVLFQWFGLIFSLVFVWFIHHVAWWPTWGGQGNGAEQGSWEKWGFTVGVLVGVQLLLMILNSIITRFFKTLGLETAYRWAGAILAFMKWTVILSLIFFLVDQIPGGFVVLQAAFPFSADWWLAMGQMIWAIASSGF